MQKRSAGSIACMAPGTIAKHERCYCGMSQSKVPHPEKDPRVSTLAGTSILIIEDEPLVALGVHMALSTAGASIISATGTGEAIQLIGYAEISAAIVDVHLGAEDAAEV